MNEDVRKVFVVISGAPEFGFTIVGPFGSLSEAERFTDCREDTWIMEMSEPPHGMSSLVVSDSPDLSRAER
jgi:hypothetical protein